MKKKSFLDNLSEQLCGVLPTQLDAIKSDLKKNFHGILDSAFNKLELVKREEFDTQTKVLERTRKKLEELQETVKKLEEQLNKKHHR